MAVGDGSLQRGCATSSALFVNQTVQRMLTFLCTPCSLSVLVVLLTPSLVWSGGGGMADVVDGQRVGVAVETKDGLSDKTKKKLNAVLNGPNPKKEMPRR